MNAVHQLRVNVKSLAAEARYIREEIQRAKTQEARELLSAHRTQRLKPESRLAHLALAFIRNTPYKKVEPKTKTPPSPQNLTKKIKKFTHTDQNTIETWLNHKPS